MLQLPSPQPPALACSGTPRPSSPAQPSDSYANWGTLVLGRGAARPEPNNYVIPEFCATANYSQVVNGAWGWSDQNCDDLYIAICKVAAAPPPAPPPPPPSPPPPLPPLDNMYVSPLTRTTYIIPGSRQTFYAADKECKALGGLLVVYATLGEQQEVENAFMKRGWFADPSTRFYWMGLAVAPYSSWPKFVWLSSESPDDTRYSHWGVFMPGQHKEPNNIFREEYCAGANRSEVYGGAFGWSDENCARPSIFICEVEQKSPPPPSPFPPEADSFYLNPSKASFTANNSYLYYNQPLPYFKAMQFCADSGGYLAVYNSVLEQKEVEKYFVGQGTLNTSLATRNYWLGYRVISNWPRFEPVAPSATGYTHWGTYQPGFRKEPNQVSGPELCACANSTEIYGGAWGWADAPCALQLPFMCMLNRPPSPPPPSAPLPPLAPEAPPPDQPDFPAGPELTSPPPPPPPPPPSPPSPRPPPPPGRPPRSPRPPSPSPEPPSPPPPSPRPPPPPRPPSPPPPSPVPPPPSPVRLKPFPPPGGKRGAAEVKQRPPPPAKAGARKPAAAPGGSSKQQTRQPPPAKASTKAGSSKVAAGLG